MCLMNNKKQQEQGRTPNALISPSAHDVSAGTQAVKLAPTQMSAFPYHWGKRGDM